MQRSYFTKRPDRRTHARQRGEYARGQPDARGDGHKAREGRRMAERPREQGKQWESLARPTRS